MNIYINGKIILENEILDNHVLCATETIEKICPREAYEAQANDQVIDLQGRYLAPGFVNVHIHGSNGFDVMDGTKEALFEIGKVLPHSGVTSYLATTMTMERDKIHKALECTRAVMETPQRASSELLGIHAEGPFVSEAFKGAQNPEFILSPAYDFYKPHYDIIKIITIAPEEDKGFHFAKAIKKYNASIILSIGHSSASYDTSIQAYDEGYTHITHLFNAMTGLHHREPGIVGAALTHKFYTEIIADNVHVRPELYQLVLNSVGKDRLILITDAMCAACLSPGVYALGGQEVLVDQTSARLNSGALAGSILTMDQALRNIYKHTNISLYEAINLASKNPAEELGLYNRIGSIAEHKDADLVIMDDDFNIYQTYCKGQLAYSKEEIYAT